MAGCSIRLVLVKMRRTVLGITGVNFKCRTGVIMLSQYMVFYLCHCQLMYFVRIGCNLLMTICLALF